MDIRDVDLNLLRVFDAIYRLRSVSRAALELGLSQPAASQALTRLRLLLGNTLFERTHGGVRPTPRADQLAVPIGAALQLIESGVREAMQFDPAKSRMCFRLHMSDIGEARFLPALTRHLQRHAPHVQLQCKPWPLEKIGDALHRGSLDVAIGFLPELRHTHSATLVQDRYVVMLRHGHPALSARDTMELQDWLQGLDYLAISSHTVPLQILSELELESRIRVTAAHFLAVPSIVQSTDLAVVMPLQIAQVMGRDAAYALQELPEQTQRHFAVDLHWSHRAEHESAKQWLISSIQQLFPCPAPEKSPASM